MTSAKLVAAGFGAVFGFAISWGHFTDPDEIRQMLLLEDLYLWKMFALAVTVAFVGARLVRGTRARLTGEPVGWVTLAPRRRHVTGAATFGVGWAVAASCPAPIAAQLAQGVGWSLFTFAGVATGVLLYQRREAATRGGVADAGPDTPGRAGVAAGVSAPVPPVA